MMSPERSADPRRPRPHAAAADHALFRQQAQAARVVVAGIFTRELGAAPTTREPRPRPQYVGDGWRSRYGQLLLRDKMRRQTIEAQLDPETERLMDEMTAPLGHRAGPARAADAFPTRFDCDLADEWLELRGIAVTKGNRRLLLDGPAPAQ